MKNKFAIAVFNPQDPLEMAVQDICYEHMQRWLPASNIKDIIEAIIGYEGLYEEFLRQPKVILQEILSATDNDTYICVPCYTLELRQILRNHRIVSPYKIAAFSTSFAKHYLSEYPVLLVLDTRRLKEPQIDIGKLKIYSSKLDISGALVRVLCRERVDSWSAKATEKIVLEEYPGASVHPIGELPSYALPKVAQVHHLKKYVVNIGSLGIENDTIKAHSPEEACQDALTRKRKSLHLQHIDPKFTVDFWKNTEYWPIIVKEAKTLFTIKQAEINTNIQLSPSEQKIFDFLIGVNNKYNLGLTMRVAGGWVRDKAIGKESDDIDIALDKMTGAQFGEYIAKEIGKSGNVIKANPDQSKHLETMTIRLFGQDVDFVNLRSESYGDSRIPEMAFGDAKTDAFRRDLTINALFYNINSGQVEDFTGKGIADLNSMTLRTPLEPVKTFTDDPLRILRMLRFYSRYKGAKLDPAAVEAMKDPVVQKALKEKVSPERIYTEWNKMFAGSQQTAALRILHDTGLWNTLFGEHLKSKKENEEDKDFHPFTMDQNNPHHIDNVFEHTLKVIEKYDAILRADGAGDEERAKALSAAFLHDIGKLDPRIIGIRENAEGIVSNTYHGHEDVSSIVSQSILSALKASNEDIDYIKNIVQYHMIPHPHKSNDTLSDKQIRKLINKLGRDLLRRIVQHAMADADSKPNTDLAPYQNLLQRVQDIQPSGDVNNMKPVLSGQILMQMFPNIHPKTGFIKEINNRLQDMKDENPALSEQEAINAVNAMRSEIETQFGSIVVAPKKIKQKLPLPPSPSNPQKEAMKTAETWYEEMRQMGEKLNHVEWLCGDVHKGAFSNINYDVVFLKTNENSYRLKIYGDMVYDDERLNKLVGKRICAKGLLEGPVFHFSEWKEENPVNSPNQKYIKREDPAEATQFQVGMKVKHRHRALTFSPITGYVKQIKGNLMYIKWNGIADLEVFNLNDTVNLYSNLAKL